MVRRNWFKRQNEVTKKRRNKGKILKHKQAIWYSYYPSSSLHNAESAARNTRYKEAKIKKWNHIKHLWHILCDIYFVKNLFSTAQWRKKCASIEYGEYEWETTEITVKILCMSNRDKRCECAQDRVRKRQKKFENNVKKKQ